MMFLRFAAWFVSLYTTAVGLLPSFLQLLHPFRREHKVNRCFHICDRLSRREYAKGHVEAESEK